MILINILLSFFYWFTTISYIIVVFFPILILSIIKNKNLVELIAKGWGKACINSLFLPRKLYGLENIPNGPVIFAANHSSVLDIQFLIGYLPKRFNFIAKAELFKIPLFASIIKNYGTYYLDRHDPVKAHKTMELIANNLKASGGAIVIFPEGTRSPNGELLPFKRGAVKVSLETQVPILPVAIKGCANVLPKKAFLAKPRPISLHIGTIINPPKNKSELDTVNILLQEKIKQLLNN